MWALNGIEAAPKRSRRSDATSKHFRRLARAAQLLERHRRGLCVNADVAEERGSPQEARA